MYSHPNTLERLARRRAGMKLCWYVHASVYALVTLLLWTLAQHAGRDWAIFPTLGWGLGLSIHGVVVFLHGSGVLEKQVERERIRLGLNPRD